MPPKPTDYKERFRTAAYTEKWAVTMTKVRIRQAVAHAPFPRRHFLSFAGPQASTVAVSILLVVSICIKFMHTRGFSMLELIQPKPNKTEDRLLNGKPTNSGIFILGIPKHQC